MSDNVAALSFAPATWENSFEARFDDWRDRGQRILAATIRHELATEHAAWAEALDEHALLDPLLVTCTNHRPPAIELSQCTWGLLRPEQRATELRVRAFADGRVLLPGLGFLEGGVPDAHATVHVVDGEARLRERSHARLRPLPEVEGLPIYPYRHPFLRPYTDRYGARYEDARVSEATRHNVGALAEGVRLLAATNPCQHAQLLRDTRLVIIVECPGVVSMASLSFHGAVLLSVRGHESPLFFVEELVHQGGHVTFSKVIADWPAFLGVPFPTPMSALGHPQDSRCFGEAVHDNYTLVRMLLAFELLLDHAVLRGHLRHELLGRIAFALRRLSVGLERLDHPRLYTQQGLVLHHALQSAHGRLHGRLGGLLRVLDVSDQPEAFEYERFLARNPR